MHWLNTLGLVFNVAGSVIFIMDTNRLSALLSSMVKHMAKDHGRLDGKRFSKEEISNLEQKISSSKSLTRLGYFFFLGGFALQLIGGFIK